MKNQTKNQTLIYQDQDSLNSARVVIANAEKCALIAIQEPELQEKWKVENAAPAGIAGVAGGLVALGFLVGLAAGAASSAEMSATSGPGITTGLSAVGRLIGGVVVNPMVSGIFLTAVAPVVIGFAVYFGVRKKVSADRAKRFAAEKAALRERAVACRQGIQKKIPTLPDKKWQNDLNEQIALLDSVITNLDRDTAVTL